MNEYLALFDKVPTPIGATSIFSFDKSGNISNLVTDYNAIMTDMADILTQVLGGSNQHRVSYMYMEFENLGNPIDTPTVPSFGIDDGVEYFTGLVSSPVKDFLRVPILVAPGFSATQPANTGNMVTFHAVTSGEEFGFHGKPFDTGSLSAVYGGALVSAPKPAIQANDLIAARNYPPLAKVFKPAGEQIAMTWSIEFVTPTP